MQTLGISESTPRTEGRLKSLFWPSIKNQGDVDYLTVQGFWVCFTLALINLAVSTLAGNPVAAVIDSICFLLAGAGVRQMSRFAAVSAFLIYLLSNAVSLRLTGRGFGVMGIIFLALLLANIRGLWLAARWTKSEPQEEMPRLSHTLGDKLSDQFPKWVWPKGRYVFYVLAALEFLGLTLALVIPASMLSN
jgi:hypothetical protein